MTIIHICLAREADRPPGVDLRTRAGREAEVLHQVRQHGGFEVFWVCENQPRALAADRLERAGRIRPTGAGRYPWCGYRVEEAP